MKPSNLKSKPSHTPKGKQPGRKAAPAPTTRRGGAPATPPETVDSINAGSAHYASHRAGLAPAKAAPPPKS